MWRVHMNLQLALLTDLLPPPPILSLVAPLLYSSVKNFYNYTKKIECDFRVSFYNVSFGSHS